MKKKDILNLIRYHADRNEEAFNKTAYSIAEDFRRHRSRRLRITHSSVLLLQATVSFPSQNLSCRM